MSESKLNNALKVIGGLVLVGFIVNFVQMLNKRTETRVISDEGLAALKNPEKLDRIEKAISEAKRVYDETSVWQNPKVELN